MTNQVEPNKWYFTVDCSKCGETIPFAEAPSPEEEPEPRFQKVLAWQSTLKSRFRK
jgi:hypothetical protein